MTLVKTKPHKSSSPFRILSIDGGGLRGLSATSTLKYIQDNLTKRPIFDSFDLFAGTSTGALIAATLTIGENSLPKYNVDQIERMYVDHGNDIFPQDKWRVMGYYNSTKNFFRPRYNDKGINRVFSKYLSEHRISDCIKPILITSYDLQRDTQVYFSSRYVNRTSHQFNPNPKANARLVDICRASSAAPVFLPSYSFTYADHSHEDYLMNCIDGGVNLNNPSLAAYVEVLSHLNDPIYQKGDSGVAETDIHVLSIGTGKIKKTIRTDTAINWGKMKWVIPIIDIMMDGNSQVVDFQLRKIMNYRYFRINPDIDLKHSNMTDSSEKARGHLIESVHELFSNNHFKNEFRLFSQYAEL